MVKDRLLSLFSASGQPGVPFCLLSLPDALPWRNDL